MLFYVWLITLVPIVSNQTGSWTQVSFDNTTYSWYPKLSDFNSKTLRGIEYRASLGTDGYLTVEFRNLTKNYVSFDFRLYPYQLPYSDNYDNPRINIYDENVTKRVMVETIAGYNPQPHVYIKNIRIGSDKGDFIDE